MSGFCRIHDWQLWVLIVGTSVGLASAVEFAGGTGEPNAPYLIATAEQLRAIGADPDLLDRHFSLLNDIDLSEETLDKQAVSEAVIAPNLCVGWTSRAPAFTGRFDGNGYEVRNLRIRGSRAGNLAFLGKIGERGCVKNLRVVNASIEGPAGTFCLGALAGYNSGHIINCHVTCEVTAGNRSYYIGGLVGHNSGGIIVDCSVDCRVYGGERCRYVGGLVGQNSWGCIAQCWADGRVSSGTKSAELGGLVGYTTVDARILNSLAAANVTGGSESRALGGLVGAIDGSVIVNCFALGRVQGSENVGGLVGCNDEGIVDECFWDIDTSGLGESDGGIGLTTAQMQNTQTFLFAGWDMIGERDNGTADLWLMPADRGYPILAASSDSYQPRQLDGSGTIDDPYEIGTVEDVGAMAHCDRLACYKLANDIDLSDTAWSTALVVGFDGHFDGAGFALRGLMLRGRGYLGVFDVLGTNALVESLGIVDCTINGQNDSRNVAGLAGWNRGRISKCYVSGRLTSGNWSSEIGLLVGESSGQINDSYASGSVSGGSSSLYVGGLGGRCAGSRITHCYASTTVTGGQDSVAVGGFAGSDWESYGPTVIDDCYFLSLADGGGPNNGIAIALTARQMKQQTTFAGWDFETVWMICEEQDYPHLQWEGFECDN